MKKIFNFILVLVTLFIATGAIHSIFYNQIHSLLFYITEKNPIRWADINIQYQYGMYSINENNILSLHYYGKENEGIIIEYNDVFNNKKSILEFLKSKNDKIIFQSEGEFNGLNAIFVEMRSNDQKKYINVMYIPDKKISIGYIGKSENYKIYKATIESITFLN